MGYQAARTAPNALWFGTGIHLALATWYTPQGKGPMRGFKRGAHPAETWQAFAKDSRGRFFQPGKMDVVPEEEFIELADLGTIMMNAYVENYGTDEHWEFLVPEYRFSVVLTDEGGKPFVDHRGTFDGVFRDHNDGRVKLAEHKTAAQISLKHLLLDDQASDYWMVANTALRADKTLRRNEFISDIVFNFMRKSKPDPRPRDVEGYAINKDGSRSKRQPLKAFVREPVTRTPSELQSVHDHIYDEVMQMQDIVNGRHNPTKNPGWQARNCMGCPFLEMCELHEQGGDWEEYAEVVFSQKDPYADHRDGALNSKV